MKKKLDPDPLDVPCICSQSYVRSAGSFTSRERNHPKKAFFCDDVGILDCTISICNVLDRLDPKKTQKDANMVIFKFLWKSALLPFFVCIYTPTLSLFCLLSLGFVVSIVCLTRVCYSTRERE